MCVCEVIAKLFNVLVLSRHYPEHFKINRTTLLPKPGKDLSDVRNWRPITIGSLMGRLFSGALDHRLRNFVNQSRRQKGFVPQENGCKSNIVLLDGIIRKMKGEDGGVITVVDVSKAFDTVPHSAINPCLLKKRCPLFFADYVDSMYLGCKTAISVNGGTVEITLKRGVKQGDPLSPLLFNLVMEPIIESINSSTVGIDLDGENIAILAFADDIVLIASNKEQAEMQTSMLYRYLRGLGMSLSAQKCSAFEFVAGRKTWYTKDPKITVEEERIPYLEPEDVFRYLGAEMTSWVGFRKGVEIPKIVEAVRNVRKMKLKPLQKLDLIAVYVLPKFIHGLTSCPPSGTALVELDKDLKKEVKEILHLTPSTTDGVIYAAKNSGGLGFPRLEHIVKLAVLRNAAKSTMSDDPALRAAASGRSEQARIKSFANSLRINWPANLAELESAKHRLKKEEIDRWQRLVSQGQGVSDFRNDKIGNKWLSDPRLLKPSRFIDAMKLRTNTFGNRVTLHRAKLAQDVSCRRCRALPETLGHIIGGCTFVKPMRVRRHDEIKELIARRMGERECVVFVEPTVNVRGELKKPDLVIKDQGRLLVVDVTVRYEDRANLERAYHEKIEKYADVAESLRRDLDCNGSAVLPIVVGARGAMPRRTINSLGELRVSMSDALTISMIALRSSIEIANAFIDYDNL